MIAASELAGLDVGIATRSTRRRNHFLIMTGIGVGNVRVDLLIAYWRRLDHAVLLR
jgi:hypothetical protein